MKILFVVGADQLYGTFHIAKQLMECMRRIDKDVKFIVVTQKQGALNDWCNDNHFENYVVPYKYCVYNPTGNALKGIVKHIIKYITVTISNHYAVWKIDKLCDFNNIDIIHSNINRDLFGELLAKKHNIPNITHLREFSRAHFGLLPIYKEQVKFMNNYTSCFIAISNAVKKDWEQYGLEGSKISVVYDGINVKPYNETHRMGQEANSLKLVMCGGIYEGKGQLELAQAVCPLLKAGLNISLDFYGSSVNRQYYKLLRDFLEENSLGNNVHLKGYVNGVSELLGGYDVGVICSKAEGFGVVTVEYMLSGVSVIASDTGANSELICNGNYGYLYSLGDIESLKSKIKYLYDNPEERKRKVEAAKTYARSKYNIENTTRLVLETYISLVE